MNPWTSIACVCFREISAHVQNFLHLQNIYPKCLGLGLTFLEFSAMFFKLTENMDAKNFLSTNEQATRLKITSMVFRLFGEENWTSSSFSFFGLCMV